MPEHESAHLQADAYTRNAQDAPEPQQMRGHAHTHDQPAEDRHVREADAEHPQVHMYAHNHPNQKAVSNRLARAIGHLEKVKRMVDDGEDCTQILIQMAAVRNAINNAGKVLLQDHITHCIVDAVEEGDLSRIDELNDAIKKFL